MIPKKERRKIDDLYPADAWGRKSRFYWKKESIEKLGLSYKRGRAYKIIIKQLKDFNSLIISNIFFSQYGLAPRIYRVGKFRGWKFIEMDYVPKKPADFEVTRKMIEAIAGEVDFISVYEHDLVHKNNYRGNKYLDYHGFEVDLPKFEDWLLTKITNDTHWGHRNDNDENYPYQTFRDFVGKRKSISRIRRLGLDKIDFKGKSVLDIGCNMGYFLYYAKNKGATRLVGLDKKEVIRLADLYQFYKTNGGIEFYGEELTPKTLDKYGKFDVVLYLAMVHSLGYPKELRSIAKYLLVFEGHNMQAVETTKKELENIFPKVEFRGFSEDRGKRPVFWCYAKK